MKEAIFALVIVVIVVGLAARLYWLVVWTLIQCKQPGF